VKVSVFFVLTYLSTFLRLTTPAVLLVDPFWASVLALLLDAVDGHLFSRAGFTSARYQRLDKFLDVYWYCTFAVFTFLGVSDGFVPVFSGRTAQQPLDIVASQKVRKYSWYTAVFLFLLTHTPMTPLFALFVLFFFLRLAGELLFCVREDRRIFLLFPNLFEPLFCAYVVGQRFGWPNLGQPTQLAVVLLTITPTKLLLEYLLHVRLFSFSNFLFGEGSLSWPQSSDQED
jgi:hypothetical protein